MNGPKTAAAYHPGDAPVTRPDLDALMADLRRNLRLYADPAADLIARSLAALAAERARADQAERELAAVEERVTDALLMGTRLDSVKADVMRALQPYAAPTAEQGATS